MSWNIYRRAQNERDRRHELNARFDDRRERFAGSAPDPEHESAMNDEADREQWESMTREERDHLAAWLENEDRKERERLKDDEIPF